ncbi:MAG: T9SS type A sorting domain-containing protein [Paludibacter sp.]|nr:T9SS type A sorting domain-containing protein [Paludibacter sp.]
MRKITLSFQLHKRALRTVCLALIGLLPAIVFGQTEISTVQGLKDIAKDLAGSYKLTADLVLTEEWTPIGTEAAPFTGVLDGNGHIIKGLKTTITANSRVGLFGVAKNAEIKKLGLEDVNLNGTQDVAPFIGKAYASKVTECYSTGLVQGNDHVAGIIGGTAASTPAAKSLIRNCYSTAVIFSRTYQAGGILGTAVDVDIENVFFSGSCSSQTNTGGIVSLVDAATAELGATANTITNSLAVSPFLKGGTVHRILGNAAGRAVTLTNNYAKEDILINGVPVDPMNDVEYGAALGQGENKTAEEYNVADFYSTTLNWSTEIWNTANGSLPVLKWQTVPAAVDQIIGLPTSEIKLEAGMSTQVQLYSAFAKTITTQNSNPAVATIDATGTIDALSSGTTTITVSTEASAFAQAVSKTFVVKVITISGEIRTAEDLDNIRYKLDGVYTLMNDITLTGNWTPIAEFKGTFNGNGHVIKGLNYNDPSVNNVGLFASTSGATITKLGIEDARLIGNADVGGIVGNAKDGSQISECYVANSYIEGRDHVGSIVGAARYASLISNCYGTATIYSRQYQAAGIAGILQEASIDKCFFSGTASISGGGSNVGGMTSLLDGGTPESTIISNCVTLAPYLIGNNVCRIMGTANGKEYALLNNYARTDVFRGKTVNSLSGISLEDANMGTDKLHGGNVSPADTKTKDFYTNILNWDTENIWYISGTEDIYPILKWQTKPVTPSIIGVPANVKIKKGVSVKVKVYGSMGQPVYYDSPQTDQIVNVWTEYDPNTSEVLYVLFGTDDAELGYGTAVVNMTSDATASMAAAAASFSIEVVDPETLRKDIRTAEDLVNIKNDLMADYVLRAHIDLSSIADWNPIGTASAPFKGSLDGNGYVIRNLKSSRSTTNLIGMFGVAQDAVFKNIALENVNLVGNQDVGGIVGKGIGVTITKSYVTGVLEGNDHVGSIAGGIYGGATTNIANCYSPATVKTRNYQAGGLLGVASSTNLSNSYFSGTVTSTAATLGWTHNAGGLVGLVEDANVFINACVSGASSVTGGTANPYVARGDAESTLTNCVFRADMAVSAPADANNAGSAQPDPSEGRELSALTTEGLYTGLSWDFETIWTITNGNFPTLKGVGTISAVEELPADLAKYFAYTTNGKIVIKGTSNAAIDVYNVNGMLVARINGSSVQSEVELSSKGVYLVRINEGGKSVVLKVIY